jgi:hypothetical protein
MAKYDMKNNFPSCLKKFEDIKVFGTVDCRPSFVEKVDFRTRKQRTRQLQHYLSKHKTKQQENTTSTDNEESRKNKTS